MNDDYDDDDDEARLFRRAVADARPLRRDGTVEGPPRQPAPRARFRRADEATALAESLASEVDDLEAGAGDRLAWRRPEVGPRTLRRLSRGRYTVQSELDLHGMTAAEADAALEDFLGYCVSARHRCVRIVHGKGLGSGPQGPVLKNRVSRFLRRCRPVIAFASARQVDGGTGAVYVLLRES